MDRTHFLASQAFTRDIDNGPATKDRIDAFYDEHGLEVFARAYRLRRWIRSLAGRPRKSAKSNQVFAATASSR